MEEPVKETVIIVHGTWASPKADREVWYYSAESFQEQHFTVKLNAALQERGSAARCWAHCRTGNVPFFYWSGENSWIERSRAAEQLGRYIWGLSKNGWRCHIVAHSHGGNVVVEALPLIIAGLKPSRPCRIVTLGTPFMDVTSPALDKDKRWRANFLNLAIMFFGFWLAPSIQNLGSLLHPTLAGAGAAFFLLLLLLAIVSRWREDRIGQLKLPEYFKANWRYVAFEATFWLSAGGLVWFTILPPYEISKIGVGFGVLLFAVGIRAWGRAKYYQGKPQAPNPVEPPPTHPRLLAISSRMDEAWQVLHHLRNSANPIAVRSSLFRYLSSTFRSSYAQRVAADRLHYGTIDINTGCGTIFLYLWLLGAAYESFGEIKHELSLKIGLYGYSILWLHVGLPVTAITLFMLFLGGLSDEGRKFLAGFFYPFRWCRRILGTLVDVVMAIGTYVIRAASWPVFLKLAMGLDGYRLRVPTVEQYPSNISAECVEYENMPSEAELRALNGRRDWVAHHVDDVSQMFSKISIGPADIQALLHAIESDQTLVHAAYYTDDHCIAKIADWLAAEDDSPAIAFGL